MRLRRRRGMSLVEVMVVIAIVLTLTSVLAIGIMSTWQRSRADVTRLTLTRVGQALELYVVQRGRPPSDVEGLVGLGMEIPTDAWGRPLSYRTPGQAGAPYELVSLGADGEEGGTGNDEDIVWAPSAR